MMTSCQSSRLKSKAQKQMELTLKEVAKDPSSVKFANAEVVYNDDSLCIIHVDFTGKNGLGNEMSSKMEYVMLSYNEKCYEAFQRVTSETETVYQSKEDFEKNKEGQIYEKLSYESALFYSAAVLVNGQGREAGVKDGETFNIPVPTGTGSWQIGTFRDEFGEKTKKSFLYIQGSGIFSNSATTNSRLSVCMYVFGNEVNFLLGEYGTNVVKTSGVYDVHAKDTKGQVYSITMFGDPNTGRLTPSYNDSATFSHLLNSNGIVMFSIRECSSYGTASSYIFKVDVTGYEKAKEYFMASNPYIKQNRDYVEKVSKDPAFRKFGGVYCKILKEGKGRIPNDESLVKVNYEGKTIDGIVFDKSDNHGGPAEMRVNLVIQGWIDALTHMPVGSVWEVVVPADLAYGDREAGNIKPYSTLIFKIELLSCSGNSR